MITPLYSIEGKLVSKRLFVRLMINANKQAIITISTTTTLNQRLGSISLKIALLTSRHYISLFDKSLHLILIKTNRHKQQIQHPCCTDPPSPFPLCCCSLSISNYGHTSPYLAITLARMPSHSLTMMGRIGFIAFRPLYCCSMKSLQK